MNIYITGGTGFIGSYVVKALASKKNRITVLARNPKKAPGLKKLPNVRVVKANMRDFTALKKQIKKPDALIHVALCWGETGPDMIKNETLSSVRLIDLGVKKGAKKIIFTSSTAVTGFLSYDKGENDIREPFDFYGATKSSVEVYISAYSYYHKKIKFNVIRPGYTFGNPVVKGGPMEPDTRFRDICKKAKEGKTITVTKHDGTQFIWAGDLAKIYRKVLYSGLSNEIFFGLGKTHISWAQIAKWAIEYAGSKSKLKITDKGWSSKPFYFKVNKIKKYFGLSFNPVKEIKKHIKYLVDNL